MPNHSQRETRGARAPQASPGYRPDRSAAVDTRWARRKLDRARTLLAELENSTRAWLEPTVHPLELAVVGDCRIDAVLEFASRPPIDDWSLIVGDCAHNIRTALDVFVWANSTGLDSEALRQVAYPILSRRDGDLADHEALPHRLDDQPSRTRKRIVNQIAGLSEPLRSRVIENMRWASMRHQGDLIWHQRLPLIRELDDTDKHRLAVQLDLAWGTATWDAVPLGPDASPIDASIDWAHGAVAEALRTGVAVVASAHTEQRVAGLRGTASVQLHVRVQIFDLWLPVPQFLRDAIEDVEGLLEVLAERE
jgi:hypothetical protein